MTHKDTMSKADMDDAERLLRTIRPYLALDDGGRDRSGGYEEELLRQIDAYLASIESKESAAETPEEPNLSGIENTATALVLMRDYQAKLRSLAERQQALIRGLEKDAGRYRWLRSSALDDAGDGTLTITCEIPLHNNGNQPEEIDAAIDAAQAAQSGEGT